MDQMEIFISFTFHPNNMRFNYSSTARKSKRPSNNQNIPEMKIKPQFNQKNQIIKIQVILQKQK